MLGEDCQVDDEAEKCQARALIEAPPILACRHRIPNYFLLLKLAGLPKRSASRLADHLSLNETSDGLKSIPTSLAGVVPAEEPHRAWRTLCS
jgi:hypothetical protein